MAKKYDDWTREELLKEVKQLVKRKKYGLVWDYKEEEVVEQCETKLPVLDEEAKKKILDTKSSLNHILIEGDNFHSLSVLNYTHSGKIDLIYIDPPYNTGNRDFIFNDHYVDREDSYRHSKWLNFMANRLRLAKNLLSVDGCIFMNIDDNEIAQLKFLCDEIFGEQNFVANFIWNHRKSSQNDIDVSLSHNYTLCYAKRRSTFKLNPKKVNKDKFSNPDNDPRGDWVADPFDAPAIRENLQYEITNPNTGKVFLPPAGRHWRFSKEKYEAALKDNRVIFGKTGKSKPQYKRFYSEAKLKGENVFTIWDDVGTATSGTKELMKIFNGEKRFETPKPLGLMKRIIEVGSKDNSIILDFFAGSGTTGQAVLEANQINGSKRQFILCTNNENNNGKGYKIADDICYPRIQKTLGQLPESGSLRYYRTKFVDKVKTDKDKRDFVTHATEMLCLAEFTFNEIIFKEGMYSLFENDDQITGIIYDEDFIGDFNKAVRTHEKPLVIYVFSYDNAYDEEDFKDTKGVVKVKPIPSSILNVYEKIERESARRINL